MEQITIFIMAIALGMILDYLIIVGTKRLEEKYGRDHKDTQSDKEGNPGLYLFPPEKGAESSVPGGSDNGESLDTAAKEAIRSRDYVAQYCNDTDCIKCCFGDGNGGCSLISGPPCMWVKKGVDENGI